MLNEIDTSNISVIISLISLVISIFVAFYIALRYKYFKKQIEYNSLSQIVSINRDLIKIGLDNPDLFGAIDSHKYLEANSAKEAKQKMLEKRYLQLWLNQFYLIWQAEESNIYLTDAWKPQKKDMKNTFQNTQMKNHWEQVKKYYSNNFQKYVDQLINE